MLLYQKLLPLNKELNRRPGCVCLISMCTCVSDKEEHIISYIGNYYSIIYYYSVSSWLYLVW